MKVVPIGGLCNRLRTIFSYRAVYGSLEVLWARSDAVHGGLLADVFRGINGVQVWDIGSGHAHDYVGDATVAYQQVHPAAQPTWVEGYQELEPLPHIMSRVDAIREAASPPGYVAIHARRCDHIEHAKKFGHQTTDEELLAWYANGWEHFSLFLATDGQETQRWFRSRVEGVMTIQDVEIVNGYERRPGTLDAAVVDLFACAKAQAFRGSWMSSFSETVELLRCGGQPAGGFNPRIHMPSADAEWYRGRPDRAIARLKEDKT